MEIKTTKEIMWEYVEEDDHCLKIYDDSKHYTDIKWVVVNDLRKRYIEALKEKSKDKVLQKMFDIFVDLGLRER